MTLLIHHIPQKQGGQTGFPPPCDVSVSCLLRILRHSGARLPSLTLDWSELRGTKKKKRTKNQHMKQTVHFLSVREQKLEFVNIMFVVWF